ncbi:MAG: hypothetical protein ACE5JX_17415 [Acidobacteriota bacterium]
MHYIEEAEGSAFIKIVDAPCQTNCARSANILLSQFQFGRLALTTRSVLW